MDKQRLQRKIEERQKKWDMLSEKLSRLEQARIPETQTDEIFRLDQEIAKIKAEREQVEKELNDIEAKLNEDVSSIVEDELARKKEQEADEQAQADHRLEEERRLGEEFEFNVVTVNARGDVMQIEHGKARQQIEDLGNGIILEMVYIPGGTFLMGQTEAEKEYLMKREGEKMYKILYVQELPQHQVTVAPFYMGKFPVTQEQWKAVMEEVEVKKSWWGGEKEVKKQVNQFPPRFKGAKRPIENVLWHEAVEFCNRLSLKTGHVYRLPSEAEWEYACRAGTTTPFHFGETITMDLANYVGETYASEPEGTAREQTTDVGSFPPNAFGLYDMHGNVLEWCQDWYNKEYYAHSPSENPRGPETGSNHVVRGGGWNNPVRCCRAAERYDGSPYTLSRYVGFRLVRTPL